MTENLASAGRGEGLAGLVMKLEAEILLLRGSLATIHLAGTFGPTNQTVVERIQKLEFTDAQARQYIQNAQIREHRITELETALEAAAPAGTGPVTGETSDGYHTFNELYEHRHALFSIICAKFGGWKATLHEDGTMFDGWFIAGVQTPLGQATSHLPLSWWEHFKCDVRVHAPKWDGHTAADVPKRI